MVSECSWNYRIDWTALCWSVTIQVLNKFGLQTKLEDRIEVLMLIDHC